MPESILTILKFCFLALVYLFLAWVVRNVGRELSADELPQAPRRPQGTQVPPGRQTGRQTGRAPAPRAAGPVKLKVIEPAESAGRMFIVGKEVTLGRASGCDIVLSEDTYVSQLHARVYVSSGETLVEDLGSTNGTYLNNERLSAARRLQRGDVLQVGQTSFEVV